MKIRSVRIKNFRALKDVSVHFDAVTSFIGPNGAGKSTVLRALDWFFNGKNGALDERDCSYGAVDEPIEVQVTFEGLTERDRGELGKYVSADVDTFTAWKHRHPDGSEVLSANAKGLPEFDPIKSAPNATAKKERYKALRESRDDLELVAASTGPAIDQAVVEWESNHLDSLVDVPESLQTNFFGFNSNGKMSGLFDFVLVSADLRATEESVDAKASIIGRILERSVDRAAADLEIEEIVKESREKQQAVYNSKFKDQLAKVTKDLNATVSSYAQGRSISVSPAEVELKAPRTTFDVAVVDGDTTTRIDRQGHGFQRTLLISALQVLAQSSAGASDGVICLAIEEPELFQHPIQAQAFAKVLRSLAEDDRKRIQVTYATHSPYFVEARFFHQVRRLTRADDPNRAVTVHASTVPEVRAKLESVSKPRSVEQQLDGVVANQLSVALFANVALLVEGPTECAVFYGLGDRDEVGSLEARGVSVVPVGGKTGIPIAHAILTSLGISAYALFDGDSEFEKRAIASGKSADKVADERKSHVAGNRTTLRYFNMPETDFPEEQVTDAFAVFQDHLETFMLNRWPEWQESCNSIEASAGILLRKNQSAYRAATLTASGEVPVMLTNILDRVLSYSAENNASSGVD